jgi:hypothetical protein
MIRLGKIPIRQGLLQKYIIFLCGNKASPAVSHGELSSRNALFMSSSVAGSPIFRQNGFRALRQ